MIVAAVNAADIGAGIEPPAGVRGESREPAAAIEIRLPEGTWLRGAKRRCRLGVSRQQKQDEGAEWSETHGHPVC